MGTAAAVVADIGRGVGKRVRADWRHGTSQWIGVVNGWVELVVQARGDGVIGRGNTELVVAVRQQIGWWDWATGYVAVLRRPMAPQTMA